MGRYLGPSCRLCRREGSKLYLKGDRCLTGKCALSKKKKAPGMAKAKKGKSSYYGLQLREKQKVKRFYFVSELQFKKSYFMGAKAQGNTGEMLIQFLERRLDNVVYRLGFAVSRKQARFLVSYGHFTVNGKKATIPSMILKKGDVVAVKESSKNMVIFEENAKRENRIPNWLEKVDSFNGKVMELSQRADVTDIPIKEQMIVELYSK